MLLLLLSWNKSKETRQERTAKKQERSQKETKEQGRTKKLNKRKRETGNEKEKWRKPRRKKLRHWEMNKNNPFSGGKQCFCKQTNKKTKRKERFRANCPKNTRAGLRRPKLKKKTQKRAKHEKKRGDFQKIPLQIYKNAVDKRTPENFGKSIRTAAASRFLAAARIEPKPRRRCKFENAPKTSQIGPRPEKMGKTSFSKSPRFCSPRPFFAFQNQFGQKFELPKKQICETPKKLRQKWTATWRRYNGSNAIQPGPATQNCSETPCFQAMLQS